MPGAFESAKFPTKKNNKIGKNIPQSDFVEWQLFTSLNYINQQVNVNSLKSSSFNS